MSITRRYEWNTCASAAASGAGAATVGGAAEQKINKNTRNTKKQQQYNKHSKKGTVCASEMFLVGWLAGADKLWLASSTTDVADMSSHLPSLGRARALLASIPNAPYAKDVSLVERAARHSIFVLSS